MLLGQRCPPWNGATIPNRDRSSVGGFTLDNAGVRRIRFRSPGVKPGQKIGPLGPFRGRLGLQWVIAPLVLGLLLGVVGWLFLREGAPGPPWRPTGRLEALPAGSARRVAAGLFVGRAPDGRPYAVAQEEGCPLRVDDDGYTDCKGERYALDGTSVEGEEALDLLPVRVHRGEIFIDPTRRIER